MVNKSRRKFCINSGLFLLGLNLPISAFAKDKITYSKINPLPSYASIYMSSTTDPKKRRLYFVSQMHDTRGWGFNEDEIQESIKETLPYQVSVYRILDYLYKNGLQLIASENIRSDDFSDVENPHNFRLALEKEIRENPSVEESVKKFKNFLKSYDDKVLSEFLSNGRAASFIGAINEDLYEMGFKTHEDVEREKKIKGIIERMEKGISPSLEEKSLIHFDLTIRAKERSMEAIEYALEHSDRLYKKGLIKNKDAAIVIGQDHFKDYIPFFSEKRLREVPYNVTMIVSKPAETLENPF